MPYKKRHHFVPKFYLRHFGTDRSVGLYNLRTKTHVSSASIRDQCQRSYLYGHDPTLENAFETLEDRVSKVINSIIATNSPPAPLTGEHLDLLLFLIYQYGRTPAAARLVNEFAARTTRAILKTPGLVPDDLRAMADEVEIEHDFPILLSLEISTSLPCLLLDLAIKVLVNNTASEFITSDSPVVLFNQWCQGAKGMGATGLASRGLQIFLPLSSSHVLMLFDPSIYHVGNQRKDVVEIATSYDVTGINRLQVITVEENLYYTGKRETAEEIDSLPFDWRQTRAEGVVVHRAVSEDDDSELIYTYSRPSVARLDATFTRVTRSANEISLPKRIRASRPAALAAYEAINGSLYEEDTAPKGPRTWRVVDD